MNFLFLLVVLSIFFHKTNCIRPSIAYGRSLKVNANDESNTKDSEPWSWYYDMLQNERTKEDIILNKMDEKEREDLVLDIAKEAILIIEDMFDEETPLTKTEISVSIYHKNKDEIVLAVGCFFVISVLVLLIKFNTKENKVVPKDLQKKTLQI